MNTRCYWAGAIAFAAGASGALAEQAQVRDEVGGETASGSPGGFFVPGTGDSLRGTFDAGPLVILLTGTFAFEADEGDGFVPFNGYCFEPSASITFDTNPPDTVGLPFEIQTGTEAGLTPSENLALETLWSNAFETSMMSDVGAAAFQSFVWELTQDDTFDLTAGNFRLNQIHAASAAATALANQWYDNIVNGIWTSRLPIQVYANPDSQNIVRAIPAPGMVGGLAGLGVILVGRRRRRST